MKNIILVSLVIFSFNLIGCATTQNYNKIMTHLYVGKSVDVLLEKMGAPATTFKKPTDGMTLYQYGQSGGVSAATRFGTVATNNSSGSCLTTFAVSAENIVKSVTSNCTAYQREVNEFVGRE